MGSGWSFRRVIYLLMGILIMIQAVGIAQWWGMALGLYFAAMGLFGFGCAAGHCAVQYTQNTENRVETISESTFKETLK